MCGLVPGGFQGNVATKLWRKGKLWRGSEFKTLGRLVIDWHWHPLYSACGAENWPTRASREDSQCLSRREE